MSNILERIQTLQAVEWLDNRIGETGKAIGLGPEGIDEETGRRYLGSPVFDERHKVYRNLRQRLLDACPDVAEIVEALGPYQHREKLLEKWLEKNGVE